MPLRLHFWRGRCAVLDHIVSEEVERVDGDHQWELSVVSVQCPGWSFDPELR